MPKLSFRIPVKTSDTKNKRIRQNYRNIYMAREVTQQRNTRIIIPKSPRLPKRPILST